MADVEFAEHLKLFAESGFLNNTMLILMADHGHRFAKMRETHQGQLEERLPLFAIVMPDWFKREYPQAWENLKSNRKKLVAPFDVHETLKTILNWREPTKAPTNSQRGVSLFDEIPVTRSCKEAGIDAHWCVCLQWLPAPISDPIGAQVARLIVHAINDETERERKLCSPLSLDRIEDVKMLVPHANLLKYKSVKDVDGFEPDLSGDTKVSFALYQLKFRTKPGDALYEATVRTDLRTSPGKVFIDLDVVSHINKYGDRPHCVIDKDYFLAKWCVCYDKI